MFVGLLVEIVCGQIVVTSACMLAQKWDEVCVCVCMVGSINMWAPMWVILVVVLLECLIFSEAVPTVFHVCMCLMEMLKREGNHGGIMCSF